MIWQVHLSRRLWVNVEAETPERAACKAVEDVEVNTNEFPVGCGGEVRSVRVEGDGGQHVVAVTGRTAPIYEGEVVR